MLDIIKWICVGLAFTSIIGSSMIFGTVTKINDDDENTQRRGNMIAYIVSGVSIILGIIAVYIPFIAVGAFVLMFLALYLDTEIRNPVNFGITAFVFAILFLLAGFLGGDEIKRVVFDDDIVSTKEPVIDVADSGISESDVAATTESLSDYVLDNPADFVVSDENVSEENTEGEENSDGGAPAEGETQEQLQEQNEDAVDASSDASSEGEGSKQTVYGNFTTNPITVNYVDKNGMPRYVKFSVKINMLVSDETAAKNNITPQTVLSDYSKIEESIKGIVEKHDAETEADAIESEILKYLRDTYDESFIDSIELFNEVG